MLHCSITHGSRFCKTVRGGEREADILGRAGIRPPTLCLEDSFNHGIAMAHPEPHESAYNMHMKDL